MNKYFKLMVILFSFQACAFISKLTDKPKTDTRLEPIIEETDKPSEEATAATKDKPEEAKKPAEKVPDKKTSIALIEELLKKGEWTEVHRAVDDLDERMSKIKRKLKSHIGLIEGFMTGHDSCKQSEELSSESPIEALGCYLKLLEHNWNHLPRKSFFSREFAVYLNGQKDAVLAKIKELRRMPEINEENKAEEKTEGKKKKYKKRIKRNPQEFFDAYYSCFKLERTSPESVRGILGCYQDAYKIKKGIPRRVTYPQEISFELYSKDKEVKAKITYFSNRVRQMKEKEGK